MEKDNKKRNVNKIKIQFATQIGFFNHHNIIINILVTFLINVLAGVILVGFTNSLIPLVSGNYVHLLYLFIIFSVGDLMIKYIFYFLNFNAILKARGIIMYPYYLLLFYIGEMFLNIEFYSFISIFLFALLYSLFRFIVTVLYLKIMSYTNKGEIEE